MTTPLTVVLPANKDVKDMLSGLVGKPVTVAPGAPVSASGPEQAVPDYSGGYVVLSNLGGTTESRRAGMLAQIRPYIDANLADRCLTPRAIAARRGMGSASHFAQAFRLAYGCSPQGYRRARRG